MTAEKQTIELDSETADALRAHASARGVDVSQVVAELVPLAIDDETLAELDRRWAALQSGGQTVPGDTVEEWLRTWGTRDFRSWRER